MMWRPLDLYHDWKSHVRVKLPVPLPGLGQQALAWACWKATLVQNIFAREVIDTR